MGPQAMWRKSVHDEVGYFDETLPVATDYEFWCRVARTVSHEAHSHRFLGCITRIQRVSLIPIQNVLIGKPDMFNMPTEINFLPLRHRTSTIISFNGKIKTGKFVNICMVTFNRLEFTKQALTALFQHTCFPHVITVVDNGSTDGTPEYLAGTSSAGIYYQSHFVARQCWNC